MVKLVMSLYHGSLKVVELIVKLQHGSSKRGEASVEALLCEFLHLYEPIIGTNDRK